MFYRVDSHLIIGSVLEEPGFSLVKLLCLFENIYPQFLTKLAMLNVENIVNEQWMTFSLAAGCLHRPISPKKTLGSGSLRYTPEVGRASMHMPSRTLHFGAMLGII